MTLSRLRWGILILSFFILLFGAYLGFYFGYFLPTFSCCYVRARAGTCFMLTLQQTLGTFTPESLIVFIQRFALFSLLVIIIGRAWCGWICPLGFLQEVMSFIRKKTGIGSVGFSPSLQKKLSWIKWFFLAVALLIPIWTAFPLFFPEVALDLRIPYCQLCPGKYILPLAVGNPDRIAINTASGTYWVMSILGVAISIVVILGAFIKDRFWCPFCPLGLILSWYRKISFLYLAKSDEQCTRCEICYNVCPMEIQGVYLSRGKKDVTSGNCTLCLKCIENCPEEDALSLICLGKTVYRSKTRQFFSSRDIFCKHATKNTFTDERAK